MNDGARTRILLVDDHSLLRTGVGRMLRDEPDFDVVGECENGLEALDRSRELLPDVVLMDVEMPGMNGLAATRQIKEEMPCVRIVILTASVDDQQLFEAVKSGADGYLLKSASRDALLSALRAVARGEPSFQPVMAARILSEFARQAQAGPAEAAAHAHLTAREMDVLRWIARGKSNKEIAAELQLAENTVKNHLKNILEKLHLENRVQAALFALRKGIVEHPGEGGG